MIKWYEAEVNGLDLQPTRLGRHYATMNYGFAEAHQAFCRAYTPNSTVQGGLCCLPPKYKGL